MKVSMGVIFTLLFSLLYFSSSADIGTVVLTAEQAAVLEEFSAGNSSADSLIRAKESAGLGQLPDADLAAILDILRPKNKPAYAQHDTAYTVCSQVAAQLIQAEVDGISFPALIQSRKSPVLAGNLSGYFRDRIFDFYFDNNVLPFLGKPEYVSVMQPQAVYKLLSDHLTPERLSETVRFILNNPELNMYPGTQPDKTKSYE